MNKNIFMNQAAIGRQTSGLSRSVGYMLSQLLVSPGIPAGFCRNMGSIVGHAQPGFGIYRFPRRIRLRVCHSPSHLAGSGDGSSLSLIHDC